MTEDVSFCSFFLLPNASLKPKGIRGPRAEGKASGEARTRGDPKTLGSVLAGAVHRIQHETGISGGLRSRVFKDSEYAGVPRSSGILQEAKDLKRCRNAFSHS